MTEATAAQCIAQIQEVMGKTASRELYIDVQASEEARGILPSKLSKRRELPNL